MNDILVSALVSTYNSEIFIKGCLEDLVNQTLFSKSQLEIIVIDAGSQQNERQIVEDYIAKYPNIVYLRTQDRIPLYAAWNHGLKVAKGKYITNANTDDRHHPEALEILASELEDFSEVALVYPNQIITSSENQTFDNVKAEGYTIYPHFDRQHLLHTTFIGHQPMWRKALHDEFGFFREDLKIAGDYEWWLRISEKYLFKHIPLLLGIYYYNSQGLERENSDLCRIETSHVRTFYQLKSNKLGLQNYYKTVYYVSNYIDYSSISIPNPVVSFIFIDADYSENTITTINTILNQTFNNFEIKLISDSKSEMKLTNYFRYDKRVEVASFGGHPNIVEKAFFGLGKSKGKYICFLTKFNRLFPRFLEFNIQPFFSNNHLKIVFFNFFNVFQGIQDKRNYEFGRKLVAVNEYFKETHSEKFKSGVFPFVARKEILTKELLTTLFSKPKEAISSFPNFYVEQALLEHYNFIEDPKSSIRKSSFIYSSNSPKVSVIIPCYNQGSFLNEAIESVVWQTYQDWECIIVNDGSTDNTRDVALSLIEKYPDKRIYYLEKENEGVAIARNFGISKSKGKYILPLDADDLIHPLFIEKTSTVLENNPTIHIVYTDVKHFGDQDRFVPSQGWNLSNELFFNYIGITSLFRKELWDKVKGYKSGIGFEDWEFWINAIENGFVGYHLPEPLFYYRVKQKSRYRNDLLEDSVNKAKIVLLHPRLFSQQQVNWANFVVSEQSYNFPYKNIPNFVPQFIMRNYKKSLSNFRILALVATFNDADIIESVLKDLISNGIDVFIIDNDSNDDTLKILSNYLNKGLVGVESIKFSKETTEKTDYNPELILSKVKKITREFDYDWFIYVDADEFLESPWIEFPLKESIFLVDSFNFNAINFKIYNFLPYTEEIELENNNREIQNYYYPEAKNSDLLQIKAWKNNKVEVNFHFDDRFEVLFEGRKTFPIPFIIRHYPFWFQIHTKKKISQDQSSKIIEQVKSKHKNFQNEIYSNNENYLWKKDDLLPWEALNIRYKLFSDYALSTILMNTLNVEGKIPMNFPQSASSFLSNFNFDNPDTILKVCQTFESSLDQILPLEPQQLAQQIIGKFNTETISLLEQYLTLTYSAFVTKGDILSANKVKDLLLYLQTLIALMAPFLNIIGFSELKTLYANNIDTPKAFTSYPKDKIEALVEDNKLEEAEKLVNSYLTIDCDNIDALNDLAVIYILKNNLAEGKKILEKILSIDPKNEIAKENLNAFFSLKS